MCACFLTHAEVFPLNVWQVSNKILLRALNAFPYSFLPPLVYVIINPLLLTLMQASENPGTVDSRHFKFYAFAGGSGIVRWHGKNEVSFFHFELLKEKNFMMMTNRLREPMPKPKCKPKCPRI